MKRKQPKKKQLTYHEMENAMRELAGVLQQAMHRISNLEYYISSYIEFRKTGKRYNRWMEKKHQEASKAAEAKKNELQQNEKTVRTNLEGAPEGQGRRPEGIRTP